MKNWRFENVEGKTVEVNEVEYDGALHKFEVFANDEYLGSVIPDSLQDMQDCIGDLNDGYDPITVGWEDGRGNLCTINGWE